jgi:hypothetical protein
VFSAAMSSDEIEKVDQVALARRQHADAKRLQPRRQNGCGPRRISWRPQDSEPGEHVGFRIVRRAAAPESGLDQAAGINPMGVAVGPSTGTFHA